MGDTVVTYDQFGDAAGRVAAGLEARGVMPGDRVGMLLRTCCPFPSSIYGALMAGAVVVPMNPLLKAREIHYYLRDSGARLVVAARPPPRPRSRPRARSASRPWPWTSSSRMRSWPPTQRRIRLARTDEDQAAILYTSGTTGRPKGAELTHGNLSGNARTTVQTLLEATPDDVILGCLPLFHAFGLTCGLNAAVLSGASMTLLPRFDGAAALSLIERDQVTLFEGVPTMFSRMLHAPNAGSVDVARLASSVSRAARRCRSR